MSITADQFLEFCGVDSNGKGNLHSAFIKRIPENQITQTIVIAKRVLKSILGFSDSDSDPDDSDPAVIHSVCLLSRYYLENRLIQEQVDKLDGLIQRTSYFRANLRPAVLHQCLSWCYHLAKPQNFIPKIETEARA